MRKRLGRLLATIGAITLFYGMIALVGLLMSREHVPSEVVLELDLEAPIVEHDPASTVARLAYRSRPTTRDVVDALRRAARDERVTAVLAHVGGVRMGLAQIQEIRDAVATFRTSGKRAVAHAETFGEFGPGTGAYYLATAFDTIYLQPSGDVSLTGVIAEAPFARDALDKLRLRPRFDARREYKTAVNVFTERGYTEAHREASGAVLASHFSQIVRGIAAARDLDTTMVRALVDQAPIPAEAAAKAGLVDHLAYEDEVLDALRKGDEPAARIGVRAYVARAGRPDDAGDAVALVYGVGPVHRGKSGFGLMSGDPTMGADSVAAAFRAAVEDDDVRAIVFRVDSPGGSYVASDVIWREVGRARRHGKPVVVSMGNVAGSGGYFVAMNADAIVAQPGTVTGSIGVLAGKLITGDFWERLGVNWDELHEGRHATMWSPTRDYTDSEWERFQTFLDRIYADFTGKVATARGLDPSQVDRLARGRIWSGEQAKERGLVDELGGLTTALDVVRRRLGLAADAPLDVVEFPRPKPLAEALLARLLGGNDDAVVSSDGVDAVLARLRQVPAAHALLAALEATGPLTTPWPAPAWR